MPGLRAWPLSGSRVHCSPHCPHGWLLSMVSPDYPKDCLSAHHRPRGRLRLCPTFAPPPPPAKSKCIQERQAWCESLALYCTLKDLAPRVNTSASLDIHTSHILTMAKGKKWSEIPKAQGSIQGRGTHKPERTSEIKVTSVCDKRQLPGWESGLSLTC